MFKWSKLKVSSGEPITPKLALATLPDTDAWRGTPTLKISPTAGKSFKSFIGRLTPDRRAETPHPAPIPSHRRKEAHVPRLRTVSLSRHDEDIILLKTHKSSPPNVPPTPVKHITPSPELQKPHVHRTSPKYVPATVPSLPISTGTRRASNPEDHSVPLKATMKGGNFHIQAVAVKQEFPLVPLARRTSSRRVSVSPPQDQYVYAQQSRPRGSSFSEVSRAGFPVSHQSHKYVPAVVKEGERVYCHFYSTLETEGIEVAMKGEAIALSWPLADFTSRAGKGTPNLYFDAGFDPRKDEWAVRIERGGFWGPMRKEEGDIPVSPHTIVTDMRIDCKPPRGFPEHFHLWPIHVRRSRGLRCVDIFRAIYDTYSLSLTEVEKGEIGSEYLHRCRRAFVQRCKDSPGLTLYNEECGMRRVDVLRGRRIFKAVKQDSTNTHWILYFDDF